MQNDKKKEYVAPLETNNEGKNLWKVAREKAQTIRRVRGGFGE